MNLEEHLLERKYDHTRYMDHYIDDDGQVVTFYLRDPWGRMSGYQKYNPHVTNKRMNDPVDARYFTYNARGVIALWGLETMNAEKDFLFITEAIFKASALHMIGYDALSLLSSAPSKQTLEYIQSLEAAGKEIYFVGDDDKAGRNLATKYGRGFVTEKDLDDYTSAELKIVVEQNLCQF